MSHSSRKSRRTEEVLRDFDSNLGRSSARLSAQTSFGWMKSFKRSTAINPYSYIVKIMGIPIAPGWVQTHNSNQPDHVDRLESTPGGASNLARLVPQLGGGTLLIACSSQYTKQKYTEDG